MFKTELEFSKNTLYVNVFGDLNHNNLIKLRRKLYYIIDEYNIFDIVINIKNSEYFDQEAFYNFLDEYDIRYGGNLLVIE